MNHFSLITDPFFYLVAIPAVLLLGISKSGFGSGFGALAVPLMAISVPVPQAAAIFMPLLLAMDLMSMAALRQSHDRQLLRFLIPFGLIGIGVGAATFKLLPAHWVAGLVGLLTLLFLVQRLMPKASGKAPSSPRWWGAFLTLLSGFSSFIAHAGGPPVSAYVIPMRLPPVTYAATMAYFFFVINLAKWLPYAWLGLLDARNLATSIALMPLAPLGVWIGIKVARKINEKLFYQLVTAGLVLTSAKLLWDAIVGTQTTG